MDATKQTHKPRRRRRPACIAESIRVLPAKVVALENTQQEQAARDALRQLYEDFLSYRQQACGAPAPRSGRQRRP